MLYVAEGRQITSLDGFWKTLSPDQLEKIEGVAMDMWEPYVISTRAHLSDAEEKIVFVKFHVAKHLGEGVDLVRRSENKALRTAGDEQLVGAICDWLRHPDNFRDNAAYRTFCKLRASNLMKSRAYAMKEQAMTLWDYKYVSVARKHFDHWYLWVTHSRLKPMIKRPKS